MAKDALGNTLGEGAEPISGETVAEFNAAVAEVQVSIDKCVQKIAAADTAQALLAAHVELMNKVVALTTSIMSKM